MEEVFDWDSRRSRRSGSDVYGNRDFLKHATFPSTGYPHRQLLRLHLRRGKDYFGKPVAESGVDFPDRLIPVTVVVGFFQVLDGLGGKTGEFGKVFTGHVKSGADTVDLPGKVTL